MAAITAAAVVGAGTLLSIYGQQEKKKAALLAGDLNAAEAEKNAQLTEAQAAEDERQFRLSFRRDEARNVAAIGASGIKMEGSPLEVLQDNAANAERDAQNIKAAGVQKADAYRRQGKMFKLEAQSSAKAADIGSAVALLQGAGNTYSAGQKSGAWS